MNLTAIIKDVKLNPEEEEKARSEKAIEYIKLIRLKEEVSQRINDVYKQLGEKEKNITDKIIMDMFSIPKYVNVKDAANIIDVSEQMIRRYCSENKLKAEQTMSGSGKWRIETTQLMNYAGWNNFLNKRAKMKKQSKNIAKFMNDNIDEL